jgi:hypothetical protein
MSYFTSKYYILGLAYATFENHCTLVVHPHVPSVATCIVIAYRVQFEHHKPLAGWEKSGQLRAGLAA